MTPRPRELNSRSRRNWESSQTIFEEGTLLHRLFRPEEKGNRESVPYINRGTFPSCGRKEVEIPITHVGSPTSEGTR